MRIRGNGVVALLALLVFIGPDTTVWAQRTTATFGGVVVDSSGGVLPAWPSSSLTWTPVSSTSR